MAKLHGREIALVFCLAVVTEISGEPTLYLTALGTLSTALPLAAFFLLVPLKGASFSSASTFFIPFVAVALGALLLATSSPCNPLLVLPSLSRVRITSPHLPH